MPESPEETAPGAGDPRRSSGNLGTFAGVSVALLFVLAWLGSDWATRFQFVVMGVLVAALAVFFLGGVPEVSGAQLGDNLAPGSEVPFWVLFAIFAFGLVVTGVVFLGVVRAREAAERAARVDGKGDSDS